VNEGKDPSLFPRKPVSLVFGVGVVLFVLWREEEERRGGGGSEIMQNNP
jgi:hypothetical protein